MSIRRILVTALLACLAGNAAAIRPSPYLQPPDSASFRAQRALAQYRAQQNLARQPEAVREMIRHNKALAAARMRHNLELYGAQKR